MPTLNWIGKEKIINHHHDVPFKILEHKYGFTSTGESENQSGSGNKIIHGDNLEALKSLLPEYEGKITCIYIDPPYNTGNEHWIYNDNVNDPRIKKWLHEVVGKEGDDLSRHDKWLCMMYPRLQLLYKLLSSDGALFVSINEEEQASLKLILDEIFGPENYLTMFTIKLRHEERILKGDKDFHEVTEQLFLYRKSHGFRPQKKHYDNTSVEEYLYEVTILDDKPSMHEMGGKHIKSFSPEQFRITKLEPNENRLKKINIRGTLKEGNSSGRFYMKYLEPIARQYYGHLFVVPDMGDDGAGQRFFLLPKNSTKANGDYFQGVPLNRTKVKEVPFPNYFDFTDEFNRVGYEGGVDFRFGKKPVEFLTKIFEIAGLIHKPNAIVLDSFGGSGSTGDAILNLNRLYPGKRKFLLIEMQDYAETITAQRIKNVIGGYKKNEGIEGSFDFYELGKPLFVGENSEFLNEEVENEKIREYIWYSETRTAYQKPDADQDSIYFLGKKDGAGYYFIYEKKQRTTLDYDSLATIKTRSEQYIIYADNCLLPKDFMLKNNIVFKKIPRDISRF